MESEQLLPKGEVFQDQVFAGSKAVANPDEKMTKRGNHGIESY